MKKIMLFSLSILLFSSFVSADQDSNKEKANINITLDTWHKAAAEANYNDYFSLMADDAVFIGTDATENWNKTAFQAYA